MGLFRIAHSGARMFNSVRERHRQEVIRHDVQSDDRDKGFRDSRQGSDIRGRPWTHHRKSRRDNVTPRYDYRRAGADDSRRARWSDDCGRRQSGCGRPARKPSGRRGSSRGRERQSH